MAEDAISHRERAARADDLHDVVIIKPGQEPIRIGPVLPQQAEDMAHSFRGQLDGTAHPEGTAITTEIHRAELLHDDPANWPTNSYDLAAELDNEPAGDGVNGSGFPDLFARLCARDGTGRATDLWGQACFVYDHEHAGEAPDHDWRSLSWAHPACEEATYGVAEAEREAGE
jgi:hypothetical protein